MRQFRVQRRVNYPFGFGLSYTDFDWKMTDASEENGVITVLTEVTNTGKNTAGKEVIQLYYGAPQETWKACEDSGHSRPVFFSAG